MSSSILTKYLSTRNLDYYVLMTFSYLHEPGRPKIPLAKSQGFYPGGVPSAWCVDLAFIGTPVLEYLSKCTF
ncbi:MAG: hypothetical protein ACTSXP_15265, partial [Promethearchaeota archaeon]